MGAQSPMFLYLSKIVPLFIYPLGLTCILLALTFFLRKKKHWQKRAVGLALALLFLGGNAWFSAWLVASLEWKHLPPSEIPSADAIVVLGGGTRAPSYPRPLAEINEAGNRLIYGAHLYKTGKAPIVVLTGGMLPWSTRPTNPADDMASLIQMFGVPEEALWLEGESANTYENAIFTRQMLEEAGINRIILVTSAMHMPRSVMLFEKQGFEVIPAPADFAIVEKTEPYRLEAYIFGLIPTAQNLELTTRALKEYLGIIVYHLRGWL